MNRLEIIKTYFIFWFWFDLATSLPLETIVTHNILYEPPLSSLPLTIERLNASENEVNLFFYFFNYIYIIPKNS